MEFSKDYGKPLWSKKNFSKFLHCDFEISKEWKSQF